MKINPRLTAAFALFLAASAVAQNTPISVDVDATDAPRKIIHSHLRSPVQPGKLTLLYPKWIPGEHMPSGPITDLVNLKFNAAGKAVPWQRDAEDMCAFLLDVPAGVDALDVTLDFLVPPNSGEFSSGASATPQLVDLSWNQLLLYPKGAKSSDIQYTATLRLPAGWKFGTALPLANESSGRLEFSPVSLETLVDSPVIAGAFLRSIDLTPGETPSHTLHVVADSAAELEIKPEDIRHFSRLTQEADALFGARHYRNYHFLLTVSDHVAHFGLEHHESSDDRQGDRYLTDEDTFKAGAYLLPHEMVHSWNGKYRRPAGLATPDYDQPMKDELLWVYEGLTDYLGVILTARSGLWTRENFEDYLAQTAAELDHETGRAWRPLSDTTIAAPFLYLAREEGTAMRRAVDFYTEGDLIWLEADVIIRRQTVGKRSLDDFCKKFHGGLSTPPRVVPYTKEDVIAALNEIAPRDWNQFFQERIYSVNPRAPLGGIENAGWRLVYNDKIPEMLKTRESVRKYTDVSFSLGFMVNEDGGIMDVIPDTPADQAGLSAADKLVAVNGRSWTPENLRDAIKAAVTNTAPIELLIKNEDFYKTCRLDYHGGEKYPHLERDPSKPDLLTEILNPVVEKK